MGIITKRCLCVLLLCIFLQPYTQSYAQGDHGECEPLLETRNQIQAAFDKEFPTLANTNPYIRKIYLKLRRDKVFQQIIAECEAKPCTESELKQKITTHFENVFFPQWAGTGLFLGAISLIPFFTSVITHFINPEAKFFTSFAQAFTIQASVIVAWFIAPLLEPIQSRVRRHAYFTLGNAQAGTSPLSAQAIQTSGRITLLDLYGSDRFKSFIMITMPNIRIITEDLGSNNITHASEILALILFNARALLPDIAPEDIFIVTNIRIHLKLYLPLTEELIEKIAQELKRMDEHFDDPPQSKSLPSNKEYYERAIKAWFR